MSKKKYYLGLDIGTDSVGYAVSDEQYNILKFHGEPAWGSTIFDAGSLAGERRGFRTARRRLDRKQQRVVFLQELFAEEIAKKDPKFFIRLRESQLFREKNGDVQDKFTLFRDEDYTDVDYHAQYPTIHHLICDLMNSDEPHDIRLLYLACSWLVSHRGHFLSNISMENLSGLKDFDSTYQSFMSFFTENENEHPWEDIDVSAFGDALKSKKNVRAKTKDLKDILYHGKNPSKEKTETFAYNRQSILTLLAGGTCKLKDLFHEEEYSEAGPVSLSMDDDKLGEIMANIGDDFALIAKLRELYDWATLVDILGEYNTISEAKVAVYEQHKQDLAFLKYFIRKYAPKKYNEVFRNANANNYVAYSYHVESEDLAKKVKKKANIEDFSKYILNIVKKVNCLEEDQAKYEDMLNRLELRLFLPKQKNTNNRVIPYQLYGYEMICILDKASRCMPFLNVADQNGITVKDKIMSVFTFRVPYFVGPLNEHSEHSWIKGARKEGKIYPWNFENMVDLDACEQNFIQKMTNYCTYLPGEPVLPKDSLAYHKYMVLNEINNIKINDVKLPVETKQQLFNEVFLKYKKVTRKKIVDFFIANGLIKKGEEESITGIDVNINSNLSSQIAFKRLIESDKLTEYDVEKIIERSTYAEDKSRLLKWLNKNYPDLSKDDKKYICKVKVKDFGRLSRKLLCEFEGADRKGTGEIYTILGALWNTQDNLMELLSDRYTFKQDIERYAQEYYMEHPVSLEDRLDEMYVSNAVRRPIYRTLAVVKDIEKAFGKPEKIFVEMARGGRPDQKGKRTKSRREQILELYENVDQDVRELKNQLDAMGEYADNKLQSDKLFSYYMQLGRCMYTGVPIEIEKLGTKLYDVDHIYPQAYVKDDSIINNKVLVLSEVNGKKSDVYPIAEDIRQKMSGFWYSLKNHKLISEEKYKRLVRNRPFSNDEKMGFINRQLTETSQTTKTIATLLKEKYPECEIVYSKARLTSEFRHEFNVYKSRLFNDLHHAVDAYLNIVTGNVYNMKFTRKWFNVNSSYSIKTKTLFTHPLIVDGKTIWDGQPMLSKVIKTAQKNNAHFTKYAFFKTGGFFDQMPVKKAEGLVPLKKDMPTELYGGYNKSGAMFFIPVKYKVGKKQDVMIMPVELLHGERFLADNIFAEEYSFTRLKHILKKDVDEVSFPMGMRPWKVNTVLSLDGYKMCITGTANGGAKLRLQTITQFSDSSFWCFYIKRLEKFVEKRNENTNLKYDEKYDQISKDKNLDLYNLYIRKYGYSIYKKRVNSPVEVLVKGKERFVKLDVYDQAQVLLNIHQTFGRLSGGCDLTAIGGVKNAAVTTISTNISNWKKNYKDVRLIDSSVTGLWEKQSDKNILELL